MGRAKAGDADDGDGESSTPSPWRCWPDVACILLVEDAALDEDARRRADMEEVSVLRSGRTAYELAAALERVLQQEG